MKKLTLATMAILGSMSINGHAREFADIYTDCGLGAMIAPTNAAVAAVTNVTWDLGTTAISSNASSEDSCKGGQERAAALIYQAYPSVESDLAAGQGEYISALLNTAGCDAAAHADIVNALRSDLAVLTAQEGYDTSSREQKAGSLYGSMTQTLNSSFAHACPLS